MTSCLECGAPMPITKNAATGRFCTTPCRHAWNNRRKMRGPILYDLFMAVRYQRALATKWQAWLMMTRLAKAWRDEDRLHRNARCSWNSPDIALGDKPWLRHRGHPNMSRANMSRPNLSRVRATPHTQAGATS